MKSDFSKQLDPDEFKIVQDYLNFKWKYNSNLNKIFGFFPYMDKVIELRDITVPAAYIISKNIELPESLVTQVFRIIEEIHKVELNLQELVSSIPAASGDEKLFIYRDSYFKSELAKIRDELDPIYNNRFDNTGPNRRKSPIAEVCNTLVLYYLSFNEEKEQPSIEYPDFNKMVSDEVNAKTEHISNLEKSLKEKEGTIDILLSNLQKRAKDIINKNYASEFSTKAQGYHRISFGWLAVGIVAFIVFSLYVIYGDVSQKLPTQELVNNVAVYNITNIVLKVTLISIWVFFISFAFKQFSVNRHLCTINNHRASAFNSYEFFAAATKDDSEGQKTLMLQLAKAIYEQSSTGYLSGDKDKVNPGILEITNMIKGANGG